MFVEFPADLNQNNTAVDGWLFLRPCVSLGRSAGTRGVVYECDWGLLCQAEGHNRATEGRGLAGFLSRRSLLGLGRLVRSAEAVFLMLLRGLRGGEIWGGRRLTRIVLRLRGLGHRE